MGWLDSLRKAAGPENKNLTGPERESLAKGLVQTSALGAAAVTLAPLPVVDFVVITPLQAAMVMAVGKVYGRTLELPEARHVLVELASVCGAGLLARQVFTSATKLLLPGLGGVLSAPYAFAVTWAMGLTAIRYFENAGATQERLRRVFEDALAEGKRLFSREAVEEFRRKRGQEVDDFAREGAAPSGGAEEKPKAKPAGKAPARKSRPPAKGRAPKKKRTPPKGPA